MGRLNDEFVRAGFQILVVLGDTMERAHSYAEQLKSPFPILADPERFVYHQYELTKNFIGLQRTTSIILDESGVIRYIKRVYNPLTWLQENRELQEIVKSWPVPK